MATRNLCISIKKKPKKPFPCAGIARSRFPPVTNIEKCECRETQRNHSHRCGIPLRLSLQYIFLEEISTSLIEKWSTTVGEMHVQRVSGGMLTSRGRCDFGNLHQKPLWSRLPSSQSISPLPPSESGISVADMLPLRGARLVRKSFHDLFFSRRQATAAEGRRPKGGGGQTDRRRRPHPLPFPSLGQRLPTKPDASAAAAASRYPFSSWGLEVVNIRRWVDKENPLKPILSMFSLLRKTSSSLNNSWSHAMATLVAGGEIKCRRPRIDTPYKTLKNLLATHSAGERGRRGKDGGMEGGCLAARIVLCKAEASL